MYIFLFKKWAIRSFPLFWWAMWAIRSGRSEKISDCERIAQVAHQKWANERIACFFERIAHSLIFSQKTSDLLRKSMSHFPALSGTEPPLPLSRRGLDHMEGGQLAP